MRYYKRYFLKEKGPNTHVRIDWRTLIAIRIAESLDSDGEGDGGWMAWRKEKQVKEVREVNAEKAEERTNGGGLLQ